ncbi:hypothetical protein [Cryptosporangium sp. NPDC048952]|uniref:hypothetical protein n=1 Tax=Cryptosporangium sp. NPDC048952 TaxID=3363961 RepID=UPI0037232264
MATSSDDFVESLEPDEKLYTVFTDALPRIRVRRDHRVELDDEPGSDGPASRDDD